LHFARESGASLLLVKGQRPMWALRVNYNESPWFAGLYTPLTKWQDQAVKGARPEPFWERRRQPFGPVVAKFNALATL
jgi:hypothetical protein